MGIFAFTYSATYPTSEGVVTDYTGSGGFSSLGLYAQYNSSAIAGFTNNNGSGYKNKIAFSGGTGSMIPISNLSVIYIENSTSSLPPNTIWNGINIGQYLSVAGRNWGGPISEVILFNSRLNDNSYADVLTIQDAQMLYFQGK
jgi:hypothetical protein